MSFRSLTCPGIYLGALLVASDAGVLSSSDSGPLLILRLTSETISKSQFMSEEVQHRIGQKVKIGFSAATWKSLTWRMGFEDLQFEEVQLKGLDKTAFVLLKLNPDEPSKDKKAEFCLRKLKTEPSKLLLHEDRSVRRVIRPDGLAFGHDMVDAKWGPFLTVLVSEQNLLSLAALAFPRFPKDLERGMRWREGDGATFGGLANFQPTCEYLVEDMSERAIKIRITPGLRPVARGTKEDEHKIRYDLKCTEAMGSAELDRRTRELIKLDIALRVEGTWKAQLDDAAIQGHVKHHYKVSVESGGKPMEKAEVPK